MTTPNSDIARRTDIALAQLEANGGLLLPEQANRFIDFIQEQPTILAQARLERMNAPTKRIHRMGFANRIMRAARNGTTDNGGPYGDPGAGSDSVRTYAGNTRYLDEADRSAVTTREIELVTKEVMAEVHIPYEVLEDNIEGESLESHIMRQMAERAAIDLEDWALNADTLSADPYLALTDGFLKQSVSNVVDNVSAGISPDLFEAGLLTMPQRYLRVVGNLKHFITVQDNIRYRANVAKRATGYGDSALTQDGQLVAYGVPVEPAPLMPVATGLFTFPSNMIFGIQRAITVETDKDIRAREIIIVLTARVDCLFDEEEAVVKYTNV